MYTYQILINWDRGQAFSERMAAKILCLDGFSEIDPQSPMGGPDGKKDIYCVKNNKKFIAGCYFPNGQKSFNEIEEKLKDDLKGVNKNKADGFIFITNQKITPGERIKLTQSTKHDLILYHLERVCGFLDSPVGYGVRLEYLGLELSKEEQISFLNTHIDLEEEFSGIQHRLDLLLKVTSRIEHAILNRDLENRTLTSLPISGVVFSSRLSVEDLLALQHTILSETQEQDYYPFLGFGKVDIWLGTPGEGKESADFIPPPPTEVPMMIENLLDWWRKEYIRIFDESENDKIASIANFHEQFLTIHPFLDGNGRVARAVASLQFSDLLNKRVYFEVVHPSTYYRALQSARAGSKKELTDIFMAIIKA